MTDPTLINEQHYYLFAINLDRCTGKCNILDKLSDKVCISNEIQDLNLLAFSMITGINESRTLSKHTSYKYEYKFNNKKCNLNQKWNSKKCRCEY